MSIYKDKRWKKKRAWILRRDKYTCQECKRFGNCTGANVVHHILPLKEYCELWLTDKNLISLCSKCHDEMHDRMTDRLTEKGISLAKRVWRVIENVFDNQLSNGKICPPLQWS